MCCPTNEVIKNDATSFLALAELHEDKLCDILQAMAPINVKTVHQTSLFHIEGNLNRLGFLSPTHGHAAFSATKRTNRAPISYDQKPKFLKATNHTEIGKFEVPRSMGVEALSWLSRRASQHPAFKALYIPEKAPRFLPVRHFFLALVGKKRTVVRDRLFSQKTLGSRL